MPRYTIYETATGEITSSGEGPDDYEPFVKGSQSLLLLPSNPRTQYVANGVLCDYTIEEQSAKDAIYFRTDLSWKMPERVVVDNRLLETVKAERWNFIKSERDKAEYGGFTWDGSVFDSDAISQQRITGAVTLAQMDVSYTTGWVLADNTVRVLTSADISAVGVALGQHVGAGFIHATILRAAIESASTVSAVEAIVW